MGLLTEIVNALSSGAGDPIAAGEAALQRLSSEGRGA
jgi:hypothetical protein